MCIATIRRENTCDDLAACISSSLLQPAPRAVVDGTRQLRVYGERMSVSRVRSDRQSGSNQLAASHRRSFSIHLHVFPQQKHNTALCNTPNSLCVTTTEAVRRRTKIIIFIPSSRNAVLRTNNTKNTKNGYSTVRCRSRERAR